MDRTKSPARISTVGHDEIVFSSACKACGEVAFPCKCVLTVTGRTCDQCLNNIERHCNQNMPCDACIQEKSRCTYNLTQDSSCVQCKETGDSCDHLRSGCTPCQRASIACKYPQPVPRPGPLQQRKEELTKHIQTLRTSHAVGKRHNADRQKDKFRARAGNEQQQIELKSGHPGMKLIEDIPIKVTSISLPHHHATRILKPFWHIVTDEYIGLESGVAKIFDLDLSMQERRRMAARVLEMPGQSLARTLLDVFWSTYGKIYPVLHRPTVEESFAQERWHTYRLTPFRCLLLAIFSCALPLVLADNPTFVGRLSAPLFLMDAWICQATSYGARHHRSDVPVSIVIQQAQFFLWLARRLPCVDWLEFAEVSDQEWRSFQEFISHPMLFMRAQVCDHQEQDMDPSELEATRRLQLAVTDTGLRDDLRFSYLGAVDNISNDLCQAVELQDLGCSAQPNSHYGHTPDLTAAGFDSASILFVLRKSFKLRQRSNRALRDQVTDVPTIRALYTEVCELIRTPEPDVEDVGILWTYVVVELHQYALLLIARFVLEGQQSSQSDILWSSTALTQLFAGRQELHMDRFLVMDLLLLHTSIPDCLLLSQDALMSTYQEASISCPSEVCSMLDPLIVIATEFCLHHCRSLGLSKTAFRALAWVLAADKMQQATSSSTHIARHSLSLSHVNEMMESIQLILNRQAPAPGLDKGDAVRELLEYSGLREEEEISLGILSISETCLNLDLFDHDDD